MNKSLYTIKEEIMNSITHGLGVILTIGFTIPILINAAKVGNSTKIIAFTIYMICLTAMFLSSTLYHSTTNVKAKKHLRLVDHCAIFLCIAGTYTPILLLGLKGTVSSIMLAIIWTLAILGIIIKIVSFKKTELKGAERFSIFLYLAMGWMSLIIAGNIVRQLGWSFFLYLVLGGILYSVGVYFYRNRSIKFNHAIWHLFILAASASMFIGIAYYLG